MTTTTTSPHRHQQQLAINLDCAIPSLHGLCREPARFRERDSIELGALLRLRQSAPSFRRARTHSDRPREHLDRRFVIFARKGGEAAGHQRIEVPVLANITEFGKTPLLDRETLKQAGVSMALYPLSAFRAMNLAAQRVFDAIRQEGTQAGVIDQMQTRDELYEVLNYFEQEQELDQEVGDAK